MKYQIKKGTTSYIAYVSVDDSSSTTGAKLTGLVFNSASLTAYYVRTAGSATAITLVTQTATGAYSSGGFVAVDGTNMPGVYRLDIPDAAIASGVDKAVLVLKGATNMVPVHIELELVAYDPQDTVRLGLTFAPNVASGSAGAIPTTGTGANQLNVTGGRADADVLRWNAAVVATPNTAGVPVVDTRFAGRVATAQAGASTTVTLDASASATDNLYNGFSVIVIGGTGAGQGNRVITGYVGSTKVATVTPAWATNPSSDSVFALIPAGVSVEAWLRAAPSALSSGKVQTDANVIQWSGSAPNALVSGRVDASAGAIASAVITSTAIATDAITSTGLAASAANEVRDAVTAAVVESQGSRTLAEAIRIILAVVAGRSASGTFKTDDNVATRAAFTYSGNDRTGATLTP